MSPRAEVVVFDVNETLSNMEPLRARFVDVGLPGSALDAWFAGVLRDGFALAACDDARTFRDVAAGNLRLTVQGASLGDRSVNEAVDHVLGGFADLDVHPDVPDGMRALAESGRRLVTLTNGASAMSEAMFARAGVLDLLEHRLSVEDAGRWKPNGQPYRYAAKVCGVEAASMTLVAVHPWDVHGAQRAGLTGAWLRRGASAYPDYLPPPDVAASDVRELAALLR
ncbi:MAG: haloacid dehalogenase type II [Jiangellales bacterium]